MSAINIFFIKNISWNRDLRLHTCFSWVSNSGLKGGMHQLYSTTFLTMIANLWHIIQWSWNVFRFSSEWLLIHFLTPRGAPHVLVSPCPEPPLNTVHITLSSSVSYFYRTQAKHYFCGSWNICVDYISQRSTTNYLDHGSQNLNPLLWVEQNKLQ